MKPQAENLSEQTIRLFVDAVAAGDWGRANQLAGLAFRLAGILETVPPDRED